MAGITANVSPPFDRIQRGGKSILVNSAGHGVMNDLSTGIVHADSSGVLTSSPLTSADIDASLPRQNLLVNGGFEVWQRGTSFAAMATSAYACDRWQYNKGGTSALTTTQETSIIDTASRYSAKLVYTHNAGSTFFQKLEDPYQLRGLTLTVSMKVRSNTASAVRLRIDDSAGQGTAGSYHTGGSTFETLTATKVINSGATAVEIAVELNASATIYLDNAMLIIGTVAATYVPALAADELVRCQRYYEVWGGLAFERFGAGFNYSTTAGVAMAAFREKYGVPSVTFTAANTFAVNDVSGASVACSAIAAANVTTRNFEMDITVASGLVAGNAIHVYANNSTSARITFESNP